MKLTLWLLAALASQEARPSVEDVKDKHAEAVWKVEGVTGLTTGGSKDEPRIVVQVENEQAKTEVLKRIGKELEGYKVFVLVAPSVASKDPAPEKPPAVPPKPPEHPTTTNPSPPPTSERALLEECDILRDHWKLKEIRHLKDNLTVPNCAVSLRQQIGGGGGRAYTYTKHRQDCPVRLVKAKEPKETDAFLTWVFRVGFSPAARASFLGYELKGSDSLWFDQVKDDLTGRLPYIREGAVWRRVKNDTAGVGWTWWVPE